MITAEEALDLIASANFYPPMTETVTEKVYRLIDDGMRWRCALTFKLTSYWYCFEDGKVVGTYTSKEDAQAWVYDLE